MRISEFFKKLREITETSGRFSFQIETLNEMNYNEMNYIYRFIDINKAWDQVTFFNTIGFGFQKDITTTNLIKKFIHEGQNVTLIGRHEREILRNYENNINAHIVSLQNFLKFITFPKPSNNSFSLELLLNDKQEIKINNLIKVLDWVSKIGKFIKNAYLVSGDEIINISSCEYGSFNLDFNIVDIADIVIWIISFFFWIAKKIKGNNEIDDKNNKDDILLENEYLKGLLCKQNIVNDFDLEKAKIYNLAEELFNNEKVKPGAFKNLNEFKQRLWNEYNNFKKDKIFEFANFKLSLNSDEGKLIEYSDNGEIKKINSEEIKKLVDNNQKNKNKENK